MVAFRSIRRTDADEARLTAYDDWAHTEAMSAPGFVHYFKGPTTADGRCMSFCLWDSRAEARAAAGRPAHTEAAALTHEAYAEYTLEFHRVRRLAGAGFTFEPYDPAARHAHGRAARHRAGSPRASHRPDPRAPVAHGGAIHRPRAPGRDRGRRRRPADHRLPPADHRRGLGRAADRASSSRPSPGSAFDPWTPASGSRRSASCVSASSCWGPPEPGRDRPDRPAGDRADRRDDGRLVRDRPGRWHGSSTSRPAGGPDRRRVGGLWQHRDRGHGPGHRGARAGGGLRGRDDHAVRDARRLPLPVDRSRARPAATAVRAVGRRRRPRHEPGHRHERRLWLGRAGRGDRGQADPQRPHGAVLSLIAAVWAARHEGAVDSARRGIRRAIPLFVLGFLALAALRTVGVIDADVATTLDTIARTLILVALAAVGMSIHVGELRETSWRPLAIGFGGGARHRARQPRRDHDAGARGGHRGRVRPVRATGGRVRLLLSWVGGDQALVPERSGSTPGPGPIAASWLGRVDYREALALQKRLVAERADGAIGDQLLLLEHPAVLTLGRTVRPGAHPRDPGDAGGARHRGRPRRARR